MKEINRIIIIGGDHHNTLAIVRCFGRKKIANKILIHGNKKEKKDIMVAHSKYAQNLEVVDENETEILKWLLDNKIENFKQVIMPCSDLAEYVIDNNYKKLYNYYYIPGFKNNPGMVCKMMDKYEQKRWADNHGIPMAKSWILDKQNDKKEFELSNDITFPCIIKPNISAFGTKNDIRICNNEKELKKNLKYFSNYKQILIQEFLKKNFEICALGCIIDSKRKYIGAIAKKIRENPPKGGGSLTFAKLTNKDVNYKIITDVINQMYMDGYRGMYDIEFLVCDERIYLNEINFRHSGNGYALIKNKIYIPYINYLDLLGEKIEYADIIVENYFIDELNELSLVKQKYISFSQFIKDFFKSTAYAKFCLKDIGVILYIIRKKTKKRS